MSWKTEVDELNQRRENARKLFGCRGIFIPANITPDSGMLTDLQGHLIHWTTGVAWLALLLLPENGHLHQVYFTRRQHTVRY